jgi:hypothetical protein
MGALERHRCPPGGFIDFENVFSKERVTAVDHTAARCVERGRMAYAAFAAFEGQHFLSACQLTLPPSARLRVVELREKLARGRAWVTPAECAELEDDPFCIVQQVFRLPMAPGDAFERLRDLAKIDPPERLLARAERDERGRLLQVRIPWFKSPPPGDPQCERMLVAEFLVARPIQMKAASTRSFGLARKTQPTGSSINPAPDRGLIRSPGTVVENPLWGERSGEAVRGRGRCREGER